MGKWACLGALAPSHHVPRLKDRPARKQPQDASPFSLWRRPQQRRCSQEPTVSLPCTAAQPHGHHTSHRRPRTLVSGFWGAGGRPQCSWTLHGVGKDPLLSPYSPSSVGLRVSVGRGAPCPCGLPHRARRSSKASSGGADAQQGGCSTGHDVIPRECGHVCGISRGQASLRR